MEYNKFLALLDEAIFNLLQNTTGDKLQKTEITNIFWIRWWLNPMFLGQGEIYFMSSSIHFFKSI